MFKFKNLLYLKEFVSLSLLPVDISLSPKIIEWPLYRNVTVRITENVNGYCDFEILNRPKKWYKYLQKEYERLLNFLLRHSVLEEVRLGKI